MKTSIGKIGKANIKANKKLKEEYLDRGIKTCELRFNGCTCNYALSFCHKERREAYRSNLELLGDFNQTILGCINCHQILDDRSKTTEEEKELIFNRLRQ